MNTANLHVLSNVADAPQAILEPVTQVKTHFYAAFFLLPGQKIINIKYICVKLSKNTFKPFFFGQI